MNTFVGKEIYEARTLGDHLRGAREEEKRTLKDAERSTGIRREYLTFLETGQYAKLPGEVYIRKFLMRYARYLRLSPERVMRFFENEKRVYQRIQPLTKHPKVVRLPETHPIINPKSLRGALIAFAALVLVVYLGYEMNRIISPPMLIVESPRDNLVTQESSIEISGVTEEESTIYINGQEIVGDQSGRFRETVELQAGINILRISAVKKHSKENVIFKHIRVES